MDAATLVKSARHEAGLSLRELALRAQTSAAALCLYENGDRIPRVDTLARILAATGTSLVLDTTDPPALDPVRNGVILQQVLELAEALPFSPAQSLRVPVFADLAI